MKRGGGAAFLPLQPDDAEAWLGNEPVDAESADALLERRWATTVLMAQN